jgi:hypothetical protein
MKERSLGSFGWGTIFLQLNTVMAGLVPAIHDFFLVLSQDVDARDKPGHDES